MVALDGHSIVYEQTKWIASSNRTIKSIFIISVLKEYIQKET